MMDADETAWLQQKLAEEPLAPSDKGLDDARPLVWDPTMIAISPGYAQEAGGDDNRRLCDVLHRSARAGRNDAERDRRTHLTEQDVERAVLAAHAAISRQA